MMNNYKMEEVERLSNPKAKLKKNFLSTRRRLKVLSAVHANLGNLKDSDMPDNSCDVTKHGQTVLNLLQSIQLSIENLNELQQLFVHPTLGENVTCIDDMKNVVTELLQAHQVMHQDLCDGKRSVAESLAPLQPLLKIYRRYSTLVELHFSALQEFSYIHEEKKMSFYDLVHEPIFQITRYKSLLIDLSDAMPRENIYEGILFDINKLAEAIGSETSLKQNMLKALQVQRLLVKRQPRILNFQRALLKEGILSEVKSHGSKLKNRVVFLFSDVLICCRLLSKSFDWKTKNSLKCCSVLPLCTCSVNFVLGKVLFRVTSGDISYLFLTETTENAQCWVKTVQNAIKMCQISTQSKSKLNIKRKPVMKQAQSPFLKTSQPSSSNVNTSVLKSPNVSNMSSSSEKRSLNRFKKMLCVFGMKTF